MTDLPVAVSLALLIGVVAGLRAMTAPAAVTWAAFAGVLHPSGGLAFMGSAVTRWIFTALALGELVTDQLPGTPSRTVPIQFGTRLLSGGLSGAVVGGAAASPLAGLVAGVAGAVVGTLGGRRARARLAASFGSDRPAAFIEDAVAIGGAFLIMAALA